MAFEQCRDAKLLISGLCGNPPFLFVPEAADPVNTAQPLQGNVACRFCFYMLFEARDGLGLVLGGKH
jgi:hypothetical protein